MLGWRRAARPPASVARSVEAADRKRFFNDARPYTPYLSVEIGPSTFFVATDDRLGRGLFVRRWRQDFRHLERAVRLLAEHGLSTTGTTFVDVGANIGTTTVRAIQTHRFGAGVAIEPEPRNFRTLRLNLVANDVDARVVPLQRAVSDRSGPAWLSLSTRSSGAHALVDDPAAVADSSRVEVAAVTLDALAAQSVLEPSTVGLLWVDVQGAEARALAGASELVGRGVPVVVALRPALRNWQATREGLLRLLGAYTGFVDLRHGGRPAQPALAPLLDSLEKNADLLAFSP